MFITDPLWQIKESQRHSHLSLCVIQTSTPSSVCVFTEEKRPVMSGRLSRVSELLESHTAQYPQSPAATSSDMTADCQDTRCGQMVYY